MQAQGLVTSSCITQSLKPWKNTCEPNGGEAHKSVHGQLMQQVAWCCSNLNQNPTEVHWVSVLVLHTHSSVFSVALNRKDGEKRSMEYAVGTREAQGEKVK